MAKEFVSILSIIVDLILALLKLGAGFLTRSAALIADGIHSGLDIASSAITYAGIKIAKKPADEEHPYGYLRADAIAGFAVVFLLFISAVWIIYEGALNIIQKELTQINSWAFLVVIFSIIANEAIARLKFKVGREEDSLVLVADAEHSRADSFSSIAVLGGLFLSRWIPEADGATAILVGLYILFEIYILSGQVIDGLMDVSNPDIENKIRKICRDEEIDLLEIKSRRLGMENFAELKIGLNKEWKMEKVSEVTENLEKLLLGKIKNLKFAVIQVASHNFKRGYLKIKGGQITRFKGSVGLVSLKKLGKRIIISLKNNEFYYDFGAPEYLVIDQNKEGKILRKKIIKNTYFVVGRGHGIRFVRGIKADRIITAEIGRGAKDQLKKMNVELEIVPPDITIEKIIKEKL